MPKSFEMDGERWLVTMDTKAAHPGMAALVFHCVTDWQRPYRVVEVPAAKVEPSLSERELRGYFANSHTMDYSLDPDAQAEHDSYGDPPHRDRTASD